MERQEIKLESGEVLHQLHDGEGHGYAVFSVESDGKARLWRQTWTDSYMRTLTIFPGPISLMRAARKGEI